MAPASRSARNARLLPVWLTGGIAVGLFAGIALSLAPLEPGALALQLAFSPRAFGQIVHLWPAEHLARYRAHFPADFALLACYGTFGLLLATRTKLFAHQPPAWRGFAKWALPLAAAFDATENALHLWLTQVPRFGVPWAYAFAALAASLKWALLLGFAGAVACALAGRER